jgi:hypothetical protein
MDHLLDVNVLVALLWPHHEMHYAAAAWFRGHCGRSGTWATCALTQAGCVRVLANPAVTQGTLTPTRITLALEDNLRHPGHRLWPMDFAWPEALRLAAIPVETHQQVTDAYLIALAVRHKGRLVTFDKALPRKSSHAILLSPPP